METIVTIKAVWRLSKMLYGSGAGKGAATGAGVAGDSVPVIVYDTEYDNMAMEITCILELEGIEVEDIGFMALTAQGHDASTGFAGVRS
jgi:hypothetical protein